MDLAARPVQSRRTHSAKGTPPGQEALYSFNLVTRRHVRTPEPQACCQARRLDWLALGGRADQLMGAPRQGGWVLSWDSSSQSKEHLSGARRYRVLTGSPL